MAPETNAVDCEDLGCNLTLVVARPAKTVATAQARCAAFQASREMLLFCVNVLRGASFRPTHVVVYYRRVDRGLGREMVRPMIARHILIVIRLYRIVIPIICLPCNNSLHANIIQQRPSCLSCQSPIYGRPCFLSPLKT
jgi:hypothetical protein